MPRLSRATMCSRWTTRTISRRCCRCSAARSRPSANWPSTRSTSSADLPAYRQGLDPGAAARRRHRQCRFRRLSADVPGEAPWLPPALAEHYARLYGTRARELIGPARFAARPRTHFGGLLYQREAEFLRSTEWARPPRTSSAPHQAHPPHHARPAPGLRAMDGGRVGGIPRWPRRPLPSAVIASRRRRSRGSTGGL